MRSTVISAKHLLIAGAIFMLLVASAGSAAYAQEGSGQLDTDTEEWCLEVSDTVGENVIGSCSNAIAEHEQIYVNMYQTTEPNSQTVYFTPTIRSETREDYDISVELEQAGSGTVDTVNDTIQQGEQKTTFNLSHEITETGVINAGQYTVIITLSKDGNEIGTDSYTSNIMYMDTVNESEEDSDSSDATPTGTITGTTTESGYQVDVDTTQTDVSRYNDGTTTTSPLQDTSIPPVRQNNTNTFEQGVGTFEQFDQMLDSEDPLSGDATVRSEEIDGTQVINVGTASYGVPEANNHRLVIDYAMQTDQRSDRVLGVEIVTREGNVIDPNKQLEDLDSSSPRWLGDTIDPSFNTATNDQFELAAEDDLLNTRTTSIQLTEAETNYINENYEAYIIYRTPSVQNGGSIAGRTVFLPFRSTIYSQDENSVAFNYAPTTPEVGEPVSLDITQLPSNFYDQENGVIGDLRFEYQDGDATQTQDVNLTQDQAQDLVNGETLENAGTITFENRGSQSVSLIAENPTGTPQNSTTRNITVIGENETPSATPAEFNVFYRVLNETNTTYESVDLEPTRGISGIDDPLRVEVVVENPGNTEIERDVTLRDTFGGQGAQYENQVRDEATITVEPQGRETATLQTRWRPEYYGEHDITVRDETENENIIRAETEKEVTDAYVLQPATIEITNVEAPESHLVEDNWNTSVEITNVGDLSTDHPSHDAYIEGWYATTWETERDIPSLAGGDVRAEQNSEGESTVMSWERDRNGQPLNYSPTFPEVTDAQRDNVDSPWHDETGVYELGFKINHEFVASNQARYTDLNNTSTRNVEMYKMEILYLKENGQIYPFVEDQEARTFVASPYRYTENHYTSRGETDISANFDIKQKTNWSNSSANPNAATANTPNENAIPTTNITEVQQPELTQNSRDRTDSVDTIVRDMSITVGLDNIGEAETGTARILLKSDRQVYHGETWSQHPDAQQFEDYEWFNQDEYGNDVVGVAGVDMSAFETRDGVGAKEVEVPVVIPNHPENGGIHEISVHIREPDSPDYIQRNPEADDSQFTYKFDLRLWGDNIYLGYRNPKPGDQYEQEINELCKSDTDNNPNDPRYTYGLGDCDNEGDTRANYHLEYKNMGGSVTVHPPTAHYYHNTPSYIGTSETKLADHHLTEIDMRESDQNLLTGTSNPDRDTNIFNGTARMPNFEWTMNNQTYGGGQYADPQVGGEFRMPRYHSWTVESAGDACDGSSPVQESVGCIEPREYSTMIFERDFLTPGAYTIQVVQHRLPYGGPTSANEQYVSAQDEFDDHWVNNTIDYNRNFENQSPWMQGDNEMELMVWDVTEPEARFNMQDCTSQEAQGTATPDLRSEFDAAQGDSDDVMKADSGTSYTQCLSDEYNGLGSFSAYDQLGTEKDGFSEDGSSVVWEGGVIQFDGAQRSTSFNISTMGSNPNYDDINLSYTPEQANDFFVSSDNVGVDYYEWTIYEGQSAGGNTVAINRGDKNEHKFRHRFNEPGYYTVELYVEDHPEYVEGQGNVHSNTVSETFYVEPDNSEPFTEINHLCGEGSTHVHDYNSLDNCWTDGGTDRVWSQGEDTDGAHISWGTSTDEQQIGIEDIEWTTDYQNGSDFDKTGNWDGSTANPNLEDNYGPRANFGDYYGTDQKNFEFIGGGSDHFQPVTVENEVWDYKGETRNESNYDDDSYSFEVVSDNTTPETVNCSPSSCTESTTGGGTASVTFRIEDFGPSPENGVGISPTLSSYTESGNTDGSKSGGGSPSYTATRDHDVTITEDYIEVEIEVYTNASADADCDVSCSAPSCGCDSDSCSDTSVVTANATQSVTVTAVDYHGNTHTQTASVSSSDYDKDTYDDKCKSCSDCPDEGE